MYAEPNFKTKKALRESVAAGTKVTVFRPGLNFGLMCNGEHVVEGPHYPAPHTWYARVLVKNEIIVKVIS